jgi:hypothetical protein
MMLPSIAASIGLAAAIVFSMVGVVLALGIYGTPAFDGGGIQNVVLTPGTSIAFAGVGWIVVSRLPSNRIGWLMIASGVGFGLSMAGGGVLPWNQVHEEEFPATVLLHWLGIGAWFVMLGVLWPRLLLIFPDGQLPSRRWRPVEALQVLTTVLVATVVLGYPPDQSIGIPALRAPASLVLDYGYPLVVVTMLAGVAAMVVRFRRARDQERAQLKWIVWIVVVIGLGLTASAILDVLAPGLGATAGTLTFSAFLVLPIAIGVAVLRYRLFEIDRIISRTIGWTLITVILVGAFAGVVVGLQALLSGTTHDDAVAVAGSTLLTFAMFQPVRRRVQRAVDRRFDRTHLDRQQSAEAFASRLRGRTDLADVETDVIATVAEVLRPQSASLWVRQDVHR